MHIPRRTFLAHAGLAIASPVILPRAAARSLANEQITLGIIGVGIRGRNIMNGYLFGNDRCRILAVCDVDTTRREHYRDLVHEKSGSSDCVAVSNDEEIYAREDIDAVVIATPDHWHATQCMHAARAGKDIYCEKPLTHTIRESRDLIKVIRDHECVFQTGSQQRTEYGHKFVRAVEYVRSGRIGDLLTVHVGVGDPPKACDLPAEDLEPGLDWDRWLGPTASRPYHSELSPRGVHGHYPRWRAYRDYCGGYLADMGAHHFDIAQWALDADASGPAELHPPAREGASRGVRMRFPSGVDVIHGGPSGATFVGTQGVIHVDRGRINSTPASILETELGDDDLHLPRHPNHVSNWFDCIQTRERPICDVEVGARTATLNQLVNMTYRLGRPLRWDWKAWTFDDAEANALRDYDRRPAYALPGA